MTKDNANQAVQTVDSDHSLLTQNLSEAQVDFLLQRTPKKEVKQRKGRGGMTFDYVEVGYVIETLNKVFGFLWSWDVIDKMILDDECIVEGQLTVTTPSGQTIRKTQFGGADIERYSSGAKSGKPLSIADTYKMAGSDALKKCASLLGIGLDLYGRDQYGSEDSAPPPQMLATPNETRGHLKASLDALKERHWTQERISAEYAKVVTDGTPSAELKPSQLAAVAKHFDGLVRGPITA